ncbi:hypothetical protein B0H19DRAFT_1079141 [Mycena capillaripes]|nr:hypothetical protein B0H19DRAFT_1079141 [Mycena capillaripes]
MPYPVATSPPGSRVLPPTGTWPSNPSALTAFDVTFPTNFAPAPELADGSHHPETKGATANTTLPPEHSPPYSVAKRKGMGGREAADQSLVQYKETKQVYFLKLKQTT